MREGGVLSGCDRGVDLQAGGAQIGEKAILMDFTKVRLTAPETILGATNQLPKPRSSAAKVDLSTLLASFATFGESPLNLGTNQLKMTQLPFQILMVKPSNWCKIVSPNLKRHTATLPPTPHSPLPPPAPVAR